MTRTSLSLTEWVNLPERAGGAGHRLALVVRPNTRTGREQTCSNKWQYLTVYFTNELDFANEQHAVSVTMCVSTSPKLTDT